MKLFIISNVILWYCLGRLAYRLNGFKVGGPSFAREVRLGRPISFRDRVYYQDYSFSRFLLLWLKCQIEIIVAPVIYASEGFKRIITSRRYCPSWRNFFWTWWHYGFREKTFWKSESYPLK